MKKKLLILKDKLLVGGTTTSFLALLNVLKKQNEFDIFVWVNEIGDNTQLIPKGINIVENEYLSRAFKEENQILKKIKMMIQNKQLLLHIYVKLLTKVNFFNKNIIQIYQKMDLNKAKCQRKINLKDYDVVISWEELFSMYLLAEAIDTNVKIAWIHPDYIQCGFNKNIDEEPLKKLNAIVAVSKQGQKNMQQVFENNISKIKYIRNYIDIEKVIKKSNEKIYDMKTDRFTMVTVARLQNISKALDRAIIIANHLKNDGFSFRWYIVGDGEDRNNIQKMIDEYNLEEYVYLLGNKKNPYPYIKKSNLFVLQSYYEGRPMAVDEALLIGTPVFVTNYASAIDQVPATYGWVVDNSETAIYQGITTILTNPMLINKKKEALKNINVNYYNNPKEIIEMITEVIKDDNKNNRKY